MLTNIKKKVDIFRVMGILVTTSFVMVIYPIYLWNKEEIQMFLKAGHGNAKVTVTEFVWCR